MLRRGQRLRRAREFARVRRKGRSWRTELLVLQAVRGAGPQTRAGITVSKRVGKAAVRNHTKRLIREGLRDTLGQVKPGHDIVVTARPPAASATYWEIRETVEGLLRRSGLLQEATRDA